MELSFYTIAGTPGQFANVDPNVPPIKHNVSFFQSDTYKSSIVENKSGKWEVYVAVDQKGRAIRALPYSFRTEDNETLYMFRASSKENLLANQLIIIRPGAYGNHSDPLQVILEKSLQEAGKKEKAAETKRFLSNETLPLE